MYKELTERNLLSDNFANELKERFPGMSAEIISNHFNNCGKKPQGYRHNEDAKRFALTLNFYSARAYDFVRKVLTLPDPRSLCAWTSSVECEPGFFDDVFEHLGKSVAKDPLNADATLVVDAMGIQQSQGWNKFKDKIDGLTNYGEGVVLDDPDEVASDALVFLLVGMRQHWKYPTGYALSNKIKANHLFCLISKCLDLSVEQNILVRVVTMDGTSTNFSAMKMFGCVIGENSDLLDGSFSYKGYVHKLFFFPDPPHMLKLSRNALHDYKIFVDNEGREIRWSHIQALHDLQKAEDGLKLGNKLSSRHVNYQRQKMKVKYAAQTFSSSVACAMETLRKAGHTSFMSCQGTVKFIRVIDRLFDLLNSRNQHATGFKRPIRLADAKLWMSIIDSSIEYLSSLKTIDGIPLLQTRRKTFVQGFIIAAKSIRMLALNLLTLEIRPFRYVLTYKMSQDHLELIFSSVRSMNGFCRNPTVRQFVSAMKRILLRASILASKNGNCVVFETDESPSIFSLKWSKNRCGDKPADEEDIPDHLLAVDMSGEHSIFKQCTLAYMGGFICRSMRKNISCDTCSEALFTDDKSAEHFGLIREKDNGPLLYPSNDVVKVLSVSCRRPLR